MKIEIRYCHMCGGVGRAKRVADEIEALGLEAELVDVSKGRFEVAVNGETIFSKQKEGRFPRLGEIKKIFRAKYK